MSRTQERWLAYARAAASRFVAQARQVLFDDEDPDSSRQTGEIERAGAREMARAAAAMKGGMAKAAQLSAYLEGPGASVDAEARQALAALWDRVPADDKEAIREVVREDLGAPPEDRFKRWESAPLAAASLGEVHAAESEDGAALAVKVQYPAVAEALRRDLESPILLRQLAGAKLGWTLSREALGALRDGLIGELDYRAEGARMERFRVAFAGDPGIVIPRSFPSLSSSRVLTMERLSGRTLAAFAQGSTEAERAAVALILFRFAFGAPLRFGLLNADPNPGNYLVLDEGSSGGEPRVGFLDFGCGVELDDALLEADRRLFRAVLRGDGKMLRYSVYEEGLLADPTALGSDAFRDWEYYFALPFLKRGAFAMTPEHVRELTRLTSNLVRTGGMTLPPAALFLWRQRLGVLSVIGGLSPRADFRAELERIMDGQGLKLGLPKRDF